MTADHDHSDLEGRLRSVLDRQEIHDALVRYCRGIDRCDEQLVLSAFHADAMDNHTGTDQAVVDRVPKVLAKARTSVRWTSHNLCNELIEVDGDVANSEAYLIAYHRLDHDGRELDWILGARYLDRFERRDGAWRIAHRTVVYDWDRFDVVGERPVGLAEATFAAGAEQARRSTDDFSYTRFAARPTQKDTPC